MMVDEHLLKSSWLKKIVTPMKIHATLKIPPIRMIKIVMACKASVAKLFCDAKSITVPMIKRNMMETEIPKLTQSQCRKL